MYRNTSSRALFSFSFIISHKEGEIIKEKEKWMILREQDTKVVTISKMASQTVDYDSEFWNFCYVRVFLSTLLSTLFAVPQRTHLLQVQ